MPYAQLTDARTYYEAAGVGPPLLLVAGLGCTHDFWADVREQLAERFALIMPDNRGIGRSAAIRPARCVRDLAADLVELLDHLQIDRVHMLGHSFGGVVAQQFAVDHSPRLDRLVLMNTAARFGPYLEQIARLLGQALRYFPRRQFRRTMELLGAAPEFLDAHPNWIQEKVDHPRCPPAGRGVVARQLRCLGASRCVAGPSRIAAPTLVIASEYDSLVPHCYVRQLADSIPGSRFMLVENCGHSPLDEQPERIVPVIADFLADLPINHHIPVFQGATHA